MADVPAHLERMINEEQELTAKIDKLGAFIEGNPVYGTLSDDKRTLMAVQHGCMVLYRNTLMQRIILEQ